MTSSRGDAGEGRATASSDRRPAKSRAVVGALALAAVAVLVYVGYMVVVMTRGS